MTITALRPSRLAAAADALGVVAGREGDDTLQARLALDPARNPVEGAPILERAGHLQRLRLQEYPAELVGIDRPRLDQGCASGLALEARGRLANVVDSRLPITLRRHGQDPFP
jgi:hypothetical protein